MTAPHETSEGLSGQRDGLQKDAWDLCAEFVEWIVGNAQARAGGDDQGGSKVDWASIWGAGNGASSDESAIGRIVHAASNAAKRLDLDRSDGLTAPSHVANGSGPAAPVAAAFLTSHPEVLEVPAPVEPATGPVGSVVDVPPEPLVVPTEAPPPPAEPVTSIPEPVADPVETAGAVDSLTLSPTEVPATGELDAVHVDDVSEIGAPTPEAVGADEAEPQAERVRLGVSRPSGWFHAFTWMRNVGAIVLLFVVWQLWGTGIAEQHAQDQLKNQFQAEVSAHHVPAAAAHGLIPATTRFAPAVDGSPLARLQIPAIGVDKIVVEGTNASDLSLGPGHYVGTAVPGQAGNVAIAGHRTTHGAPFNELGQLVSGDRIILTTSWGEKLTYIVSGTPAIVPPSDVTVLNYFGDNRITLTTCNPEFSSSQRLVVVGKLRQQPGAPVALPTHLVYHVANSDTNNWNWSLLPAIGIEICLLLLLALSYRLFDGWFGAKRKWIILVPLWAAGLYLLFGTLTLFLPTSI